MMRVCIARNVDAGTNAALARIADALIYDTEKLMLLTRTRESKKTNKRIKKTKYTIHNHQIDNYEIQLKGETGKGVANLFQLFFYVCITLYWFLKNRKTYDVIHAVDLDTGIPSTLISLFFKKKVVYHIADFYVDSRRGIPQKAKSLIRSVEHWVINRADATIVCTEERIQQIKGSHPKNLTVVHNTPMVDQLQLSELRSHRSEVSDKINFAYIGGLTPIRFIKQAAEIIKEYNGITLTIAGYGPLEQDIRKIAQESENITFLGSLDYTEALRQYKHADIILALYNPDVKNHFYSAPNKLYESMMLGKTIIGAKGTGMDDTIEKYNMGYVIDYSENSFRKIVEHIIENRMELADLKENSLDAYREYSWEEMKARLLELYTEKI